jgi:hypothetical protein
MATSIEALARELYKNDFRNNGRSWSEAEVAVQDLFRIQAARAISLTGKFGKSDQNNAKCT